MVKTKPVVSWNKNAYTSLKRAYKRIKEESIFNAEKVREAILSEGSYTVNHKKSTQSPGKIPAG